MVPQWRMGPHLHTALHISDDATQWRFSLASLLVGHPRASLLLSIGQASLRCVGSASLLSMPQVHRRGRSCEGTARGATGPGRRGRTVWGGCGAHRRLLEPAVFAAGRG